MSDPARVRVLPRHRDTSETFSVLSNIDAMNHVEEWIFRVELGRVRVEKIEVRANYGSGWRSLPDADPSDTPIPAEVLLRAADKLRARMR